MKNINIVLLTNFLTPIKLDLEQSSARRRFLRLLSGFVTDFKIERESIQKEFCNKNQQGEPIVFKDRYTFEKDNQKKFNEKYKVLSDLKIEIDFKGEEKDKEFVVGLLEKEIEHIKINTTFDDETFDYILNLEEIISELK